MDVAVIEVKWNCVINQGKEVKVWSFVGVELLLGFGAYGSKKSDEPNEEKLLEMKKRRNHGDVASNLVK